MLSGKVVRSKYIHRGLVPSSQNPEIERLFRGKRGKTPRRCETHIVELDIAFGGTASKVYAEKFVSEVAHEFAFSE
jgi:hypothetical protein